jgi:hypothetical protein
MYKVALSGVCCALAFLICLSRISLADTPVMTDEILKTYGFSNVQSLEASPCALKLTLDQTTFNEIMPLLMEKGMLGNGESLQAANQHFTGMEIVWSVSMMSALVQQTYRLNPKTDRCTFEGRFLVPDKYGHAQDKPAYTFDFDRALYKRIDWDRMEARNLMKVSKSFHISDWVSLEMNKESH